MIPKMPAPAKAGVADFSDKIMRKIKENRERCRFNLIEKRFKESPCKLQGARQRRPLPSLAPAVGWPQQPIEAYQVGQPIRSLAEQITPVLGVRPGDHSIAGISCAFAPGLNDGLE